MLFTLLLTTQILAFQTIEHERSWRTPDELRTSISALAESSDSVSLTTIGTSRNGQTIQSIRVSIDSEVNPENRPAILVVAGIDGDHLLGSEVAVELVLELLNRDDESTTNLLKNNTVYIIPQVNPDAAEYYFSPIQNGQRRNLRPFDNDRDGLIDEDGVDDLNGDGYITLMRVRDQEKATRTVNPDNPRLDKKPDPLEGESAEFVLYTEGIDNDEDGEFNEDGIGGVDLNKNFMHGYKYHGDGSGPWQLSEPETKALIKFVLQHQQIAAIVVYGQHDTLSNPLKESGKNDAGAPNTIDKDDEKVYEKVSESFVELTGLKNVDQPNWDGSFVAWAYAQYGVPAFSTPLWGRPKTDKGSETIEDTIENKDAEVNDVLTPSAVGDISQETLDELLKAAEAAGFPVTEEMMAEITPEMIEQYAKMSGVQVKRVAKETNGKASPKGDAAWLTYSDELREGSGFVEWTPFDHPQLGEVEIGGWVPYFKTLPPTSEIDEITAKQADFIIELANRLPKMLLGEPVVKQLGNNLWEVKVAVINDGWLPSGTAMAKKNKRARPFVVR
ncbi:MAG: M14 family metallopeptidase, partial [Phycisphaerales bacterium]|nr:M14 family metallopeptidase [Phycisphaerales bacterium]